VAPHASARQPRPRRGRARRSTWLRRARRLIATAAAPVIIGFQTDTPARLVFGGQRSAQRAVTRRIIVCTTGGDPLRVRPTRGSCGARSAGAAIPAACRRVSWLRAASAGDVRPPGAAPLDGDRAVSPRPWSRRCLLARRRSPRSRATRGWTRSSSRAERPAGRARRPGVTWDEEVN
jgi:hypothetical protein